MTLMELIIKTQDFVKSHPPFEWCHHYGLVQDCSNSIVNTATAVLHLAIDLKRQMESKYMFHE